MTLNNYQFQYGSFQFGGAGSPFQIISVDGLAGVPELRVQDDNRGYNDGSFSGRDFYNGRNLAFIVHIFAGNGNSAFDNLGLFQDALMPQQTGTQSLSFQLSASDTAKVINARVRTRVITIDPEYTFGYIKSQVTMFCPDPRYYDTTLQSLVLGIPATTGGRTYDRTYNLTYAPITVINQGIAANTGNIYSSPTIQIQGPITNPTIGSVEQNANVTVNVTLGSADVLLIDMANRIVTLNGSAARNLISNTSEWFDLPANSSNTIYFAGSSTTTATVATVNWKNAYI
jgi:phage-related protein